MERTILGGVLVVLSLFGAGCAEKGTCKGVITGSADQCVVNQTKARCDEDKGTFTKEGPAESLRSCESSGYTKSSSVSITEARRKAEAGEVTWLDKDK